MKLATHPRLLCQDRLNHDLTLPVPQVVAPAPVETAPSGFDFNTVSWQADGFGFEVAADVLLDAAADRPVADWPLADLPFAGLPFAEAGIALSGAFDLPLAVAARGLAVVLPDGEADFGRRPDAAFFADVAALVEADFVPPLPLRGVGRGAFAALAFPFFVAAPAAFEAAAATALPA